MPISIQALREQKAEKLKAARELQSKETFTVDDQTAFDALLADANALESRIQGQMKLEGLTDPQQAESVAGFTNEGGHVEVAAKPVYRNLGEQLIDVQAMTLDTADAPKARERFMQVVNAASGASTGVDSEGGYLVETDKSKGIMTSAMENGLLARRVTVQPISANSDGFEYLVSDDRNRTTRNGLSVYWKGETTAMASSGKVALKTREMRVKDLYGLLYVTNRMLRDAPALAAFAQRALREEFAFKLDQAIFEGSGQGQPLGIMNSALPITVAKESSQTATTFNAANAVKMLARFKGNMANAAWFMNQDVLPQLPMMTVGNQPVFIPGGSFANAPFGTLFGRPIVPLEFCETLGAKGDVILADFSEYMLVSKGGMEVAESMHVKFLTDEMAYRFITRVDGQPIYDEPFTPLKGSNTLSPFVMLAARS